MKKFEQYVNSEELKKAREKSGLSYEELAKRLGYTSKTSYYNLENGIIEPKITQMIAISNLFNRPITKFFNF